MPNICLGCDKKLLDEMKRLDKENEKKYWKHGYWYDPQWNGIFWAREKECEEFHAHPVPLSGL